MAILCTPLVNQMRTAEEQSDKQFGSWPITRLIIEAACVQLFIMLMYTYQLYWLHSAHPSNFILGIDFSQVGSGNVWSTCPIL